MTAYLLRRLAASLLLLWLVVTLTFVLVHAAPGSPVRALSGFSSGSILEQEQRLERIYGLDRPLPEQYVRWLGNVVQGDWGVSMVQGRPVARMLAEALPATLLLTLAAVVVEWSFAFTFGIWAARRRDLAADHLVRGVSLVLWSLPAFWFGLMAILLFSLAWPVLPAGGMASPGASDLSAWGRTLDIGRHLVLPALVLGLVSAGGTVRFVRNVLLEVMGSDHVRTARAKGLSEPRVVWVHGVRNSLPPLLQLLGVNLPAMLNGSLVVEVVFAWPGMGQLSWLAIGSRDYPVILATTALAAFLVILGNLAADLAHAATDPRLRLA